MTSTTESLESLESDINNNSDSQNVTPSIKETQKTFTQKTDVEGLGKKYMFYKHMDNDNKNAMDVWESKGTTALIEHLFTDKESGRQLSYSEMRSRYG